jgi:molecular chaperone DnaK (HSP70)
MAHKFAIDFGTTNSVAARWDSDKEDVEIINIPDISDTEDKNRPPVVPSLFYVNNATDNTFTVGQAVRNQGLTIQRDNRLFRNFKRGIVASKAPEPREIDGKKFGDLQAGEFFVKELLKKMPYGNDDIEQLVLTTPVASFEGYLAWLNDIIDDIAPNKLRIVDESTAAALGYSVTKPGAVVLVFDFGGGTLDLSLVQLPEHREKTGGFLHKLRGRNPNQHSAKVIAKAGRIIGGSDIDQWILGMVQNPRKLE